jgi:ribose-phosphate pyrophosphokinase
MTTPVKESVTLLCGSAHRALGSALARSLGIEEGSIEIERFPDGEDHVRVTAVRGRDVFIVQPLGAPVGEALLELLLIADACRRSGASSVSAVIPYVGYARQERRKGDGEPIGAAVVAGAVSMASFARVIALDLHAPAVEGLFAAPVEHLTAFPLLADALGVEPRGGAVIVAPVLGAARLAPQVGARLGLPTAIVHKTRRSGTEVTVQSVVGDVVGLRPVIVDDMISTAGTIVAATQAVVAAGAAPEVIVAATHGLFAGLAAERLRALPIRRLIVTDTLPHHAGWPEGVETLSVASLIGHALERIVRCEALTDLLASR